MIIAPKSNLCQNPRAEKADFFLSSAELSFTHFRITARALNFQCGYLLLEPMMSTREDFA